MIENGKIFGEPQRANDWLEKSQGEKASTCGGKVVTAIPIVITVTDGADCGTWAGWQWSDGFKTFARNAADRCFRLEGENENQA
jgi:hypothetical protein